MGSTKGWSGVITQLKPTKISITCAPANRTWAGVGKHFSRPTAHLASSLRRSFFRDYPLSLALSTYKWSNRNFENESQLLFSIKRCKSSETCDSVRSICLFFWIIEIISMVQATTERWNFSTPLITLKEVDAMFIIHHSTPRLYSN